MRRLIIVVLAAVSALTLISFAALAASAQTEPSDQYTTEGTVPQESTTPEETTTDPEPYHQVVDNATAGSFEAPGWQTGPANDNTVGADYAYADPADQVGPARYTVDIPETDHYAVFARWPGGQDVTTAASFGVDTTSGVSWDEVDQQADAGAWVLIGIHEMEQGQRAIQISRSPSGDGRLVADAVMVVRDAIVGPDGQTATTANPDELAGTTSGDTTFSTDGGGANGGDVIRVAERHLRTPYGNNRCRIDVQEDCSCHTKLVFKRFGYRLPDSPVKQWRMDRGRKINNKGDLRRGDLVFNDLNGGGMDSEFRDHVSIYHGNGSVIHASSWADKVTITELRYLDGFVGGKRLRLR